MNTDYILLFLAVVCLWTPGSLIVSSEIKRKLRQGSRRQNEGLVSLLRSKFNWVDFVRAALGAWLIQRHVSSLHVTDDDTRLIITVVQIVALLIGVAAQTLWIDQKLSVIGPVFYLAGLTLLTSSPVVAGFALVLGINCALLLRRLSSCFFSIPVCLVGFSILFHKIGLLTLVNAGFFVLPVILAFALGSRMAFVRRPNLLRRRKHSSLKPVLTSKHVFDGDILIPEKEMVPAAGFSDRTTYSPAGKSRHSETW